MKADDSISHSANPLQEAAPFRLPFTNTNSYKRLKNKEKNCTTSLVIYIKSSMQGDYSATTTMSSRSLGWYPNNTS